MHRIKPPEVLKITENLFDNKSISTLLIEIAWMKPEKHQKELSLASLLFGLQTTKTSFEILINSRSDNNTFTTLNCFPVGYSPLLFTEITQEDKTRFDSNKLLSVEQLEFYSQSIRKIINICDEKRSKIKIVFFMAPNLRKTVSEKKVNQFIEFLRQDLKNYSNTSCQVAIAPYLYNSPDDFSNWFDANHFKPSIGNEYLKQLLNYSNSHVE
ncbi:hypothetical protein [Cyanobacterium sp. Dongsha4]|uniref:hypothetical protein n=1 Tax=Cyanobacterium sp. DS4 TaxID=2878255 RepID=UPI002E819588|nr:hypothetical protein [Cyanobacterium sp. Dongsha4]WVL00173.1 hypothetical protein Dongsha4_16185 [Cyanobacterium sp. Dongsha4]